MKSPTQQFIEDCLAGGYRKENPDFSAPQSLALLLLDPLAWQAVGKTRGWNRLYQMTIEANDFDGDVHHGGLFVKTNVERWEQQMHRFIDHLASGRTIEEALAAIQ